jgi:hypothetical protein
MRLVLSRVDYFKLVLQVCIDRERAQFVHHPLK